MLDTIRLAYLADDYLINIIRERSDKLVKVSASGEVLWQKGFMKDDLPSHFCGLRIAHVDQQALLQQGFKGARNLVQFEFSLQKWQSDTGYNNRNTDLNHDLLVMSDWVSAISEELQYDFAYDDFELYRTDLAQNFILQGQTSVNEYLAALKVRFSKHEKSERYNTYDGAVFYGSSWISKKMYWKHKEFQDIERRKKPKVYMFKNNESVDSRQSAEKSHEEGDIMRFHDGKRPLNQVEIDEMLRMLRFELGYKRTYLERHGVIRIKQIPELLKHFEEQKLRYISSVRKLGPGLRLSPSEYVAVDLVKRYGYEGAKSEFLKGKSSRSWERVCKKLISKGIYLDCVLKDDFMSEIEQVDDQPDFEFKLAA